MPTLISAESSTDEALLYAALDGAQDAMGALYDRHAPKLHAMARALLRTHEEAEDVVHDAFVEAWQRAADYDPRRGSVRAWLATRVRSRAIDRVRSAYARRVKLTDEPLEADAAPSASPLEALAAAEVRAQLHALSDDHRAVVWLGYFEGFRTREIAERLAIPEGTVKSRTHAAVRALRAAMKPGRTP